MNNNTANRVGFTRINVDGVLGYYPTFDALDEFVKAITDSDVKITKPCIIGSTLVSVHSLDPLTITIKEDYESIDTTI